MTASTQQYEGLIRSAARRLEGHERRLFQAEVTDALCGGNPRAAEARFGWGRQSVRTGQHEARTGIRCVEDFPAKGALPREEKEPQLAADVRAIVEPHTQADPELTGSNKTYPTWESSSCRSRKQMTQAARVFRASWMTSSRS